MNGAKRSYMPAAKYDFPLPLYDTISTVTGGDEPRARLLDDAGLRSGDPVLDVGCGTGTLAVLLKRRHPDLQVVALDRDPEALEHTQRKASQARALIETKQGVADALPFPDGSFDHVFCSYMFSLLDGSQKQAALHEMRRVLRAGGRLHLLDVAGPDVEAGILTRWFHRQPRFKENSRGNILAMLSQAGFAEARWVASRPAFFRLMRMAQYEARVL